MTLQQTPRRLKEGVCKRTLLEVRRRGMHSQTDEALRGMLRALRQCRVTSKNPSTMQLLRPP